MEPVYSNFSGGQPSQVKSAWVTLWPDTWLNNLKLLCKEVFQLSMADWGANWD
jgi:hypothetical protein